MTSKTWGTLVGIGLALVVAGGCSSSSSGGGVPSCKGNTAASGAGSAACNTCVTGKCGSQLSSVESSCSAYVSCYDGCDCSDNTCLMGCQSKIDSNCMSSYGPFTSCLIQNCVSECSTVSGTPDDAGGGG